MIIRGIFSSPISIVRNRKSISMDLTPKAKRQKINSEIIESTSSSESILIETETSIQSQQSLAQRLLELEFQQTSALKTLNFSLPTTTVYHPIDYAHETHSDYVRKYCQTTKKIIFLGMNPGPFGMVQSGVPFGDCRIVKEWLKINGRVRKPVDENEKRPIVGLECTRNEISGTRFWNFIRSLTKNDDPNSFFHNCYVHNYCPAAFLDAKGKNITPPSMKKIDLRGLETICDEFLLKSVDLLEAEIVVGIGSYVYERLKKIYQSKNPNLRLEIIMHPSPANPQTNTGGGWSIKVREQLEKLDLIKYMAV